jgi:hypothetical protein
MLAGLLKATLVVLAATGVATTGYIFYNGGLSPDTWVFQGGNPTNWARGGVHGAPGPIVGAFGLPVFFVTYAVYRLMKRHHKAD